MLEKLIKAQLCLLAAGSLNLALPARAANEPATRSAEPHYKFIEGKGYVICEEMLKRLNAASARKPQGPVCGYDILRSVPGVTFPDWKRVDLRENQALYMRLSLAGTVDYRDWKAAFGTPRPQPGTKFKFSTMPTDEALEQGWQRRISDPTYELYFLANPLPIQAAGDVSLVTVFKTASEAERCHQVRSVLFSSDFRSPKVDWRGVDLRYPFRYGNRWYEASEDFVGPATSGGVGIYWIEDHQHRERMTTLVCNIRRRPN